MRSAGQSRPRFTPPPAPARRNVLRDDQGQVAGAADIINPEIKQFLIKAKKFLEDLDNQPLSPSLKKSKDDLYKFFIGGQSTIKEESPEEDIATNDGLEIYDDLTQPDEHNKDTPVVEEETYDLLGMEDIKEDQEIKSAEFAGNSSRILSSIADHKAWLWRKENLLKTSRYWALIYTSSLYLYKAAQDEAAVQEIHLHGGTMKKHRNGVKFVLIVPGSGKGGKDKQHQLHAENEEKTSQWIKSLERAIAAAGRKDRCKVVRKGSQDVSRLSQNQSRQSGQLKYLISYVMYHLFF